MMTRQERAKQFMAFDAMKGLGEALLEREERHTRVERREISQERIEKNCTVIARLEKGMTVRVECWFGFHDVTKTGVVTELSIAHKYIRLGEDKIFFDDIYEIGIM